MQLLARILAIALLFALAPTLARAQSTLLQAGSTSAGRVPMYNNSTSGGQVIVQDSGAAAGGGVGLGISELLRTARGTGTPPYAGQGTGPLGTNDCNYDAPTNNATGYHYLCFSPNAQGGGLIAYGAGGAASALPLSFNVNGVAYQFPFSIGGVVGPAVSVVNDAACWNNTVGTLLKDCGAFVTVGGNNTWTGTNNFTGPFQINSVAQTFPASGSLVGTSDAQTLTNKSINAAEVNTGTLNCNQMPGLLGNVTSAAGNCTTTIANGVITNAMYAAMTQNAVKGAATSTTETDIALPSCSAAGSALQYTTNTGFSCGTFSFQSAGWGLALSGGGVFSISTSQPPYGFDMPVNLGLTAVAAGSNLTINLTGANGSVPSATNPVSIPFRSTTLATGTPVWTVVTSALSIVVPSGATLGTTNNVPFRFWIFATYNSGTPELAVATCSTATAVFACTSWESTRVTTTSITGLAGSAGTAYATTGVSNDAVRIIGYCDFASGLATVGAYISSCTTLQPFGPGSAKPGAVVQTAYFNASTNTSTTSSTFQTTVLTVSMAPTATPNLVRAGVTGTIQLNTTNSQAQIQLFRAATGIGTAVLTGPFSGSAATNPSAVVGSNTNILVLDAPGTVSSTAYAVKLKSTDNTSTVSFPAASGVIILDEIMGALPDPANDNIDPGVYSLTG